MERRTITVENKYQTYVEVIDEQKLITKIGCLCGDFENRRIKKHGSGYTTTYTDEPCKHAKGIVDALKKQGYALKQAKEDDGSPVLTDKLRRILLELAGHECEECGAKGQLEIHRIKPRTQGGLYSTQNCKVLCKDCHNQRNTYLWRNN